MESGELIKRGNVRRKVEISLYLLGGSRKRVGQNQEKCFINSKKSIFENTQNNFINLS